MKKIIIPIAVIIIFALIKVAENRSNEFVQNDKIRSEKLAFFHRNQATVDIRLLSSSE